MTFATIFIIVLAIYFSFVVAEGILSYRRTKGMDDFLVAGRRVGPWIGGASLGATQMSAGTFVGTMAVHYLTGASFIWGWTGIWLAYIAGGLWIAPKLRRYSLEQGTLTFPDYIADRFNSKVARAIAAVLIVLAYLVFISAQYQAGGVIFETLFGIPFWAGALALMVFVVLYTAIGGLIAVMRTDFLQQITMAIGIVIGLPLILSYAGGTAVIGAGFREIAPDFISWHFGFRDLLGFALAFGLTFVSAPYILVRFYAMKDERTIRQAIGVAILFNVIIASSVAIIGMSLRTLYPNLAVADAASTVFASQVLPSLVGALVLTAVIAAIMSTVDSVLLVTAPALTYDIYTRLINPDVSEARQLAINRISVVVLGAVPFFITLRELDIVQFVVVAFAALLGSTVFIPVVFGLYWRRATSAGVIAAMVLGFAVCFALYVANFFFDRPFPLELNPVIPGAIASFIGMIVGSLATEPVPERNLEMFFPRPAQAGPGS